MSTVTQRAGVVIGEGTLASDAGLAPRIGQRRVLGAALVCLFAMTVAVLASASKPGTDRVVLRRNPQTHPATLVPASLGPVASSAIGASNHSFWPVRHGASLVAQGGGIRGTFTASGADLRVAEGTLGLSFVGVGRGGLAERIPTALPTAVGSTLTYRHGSVAEFYRTGPYGLEQGFNVLQRPRSSGPIELALAVSGSLAPEQTGQSILFRTPSGVTALKYDQLSAVDATGRLLPARMELSGRLLRLQVDDGGAHYPITIDPFIQQGSKVTGNGEIGGSNFGRSVALSSNGNIALIGGGSDNGKQGAAWVFTRSGSTWTQQAELTGSGESGEAEFGESVALSSEGNTALIGGMYDNGHIGAAWVFTRSGSTWTQQGAKLTGTGETGKGDFGASVALSSEGNTALIGGSADTSSAGAAWVFMRTGTTWSQQGSKLTGSGATGKANFGTSAALSSEGNTALIGGQGDNSKTGAVWVFTRTGTTWSQQGSKLTGSGEGGSGLFGSSVALSGEGGTALIGGYNDSSTAGAIWVFTRTGTTWSQQGSKLTGSGEEGPTSAFGYSVALSSEGNTALIGGYADDYAIGAAWQFTRSGSTWSQQGAKLVPSEESGASEFGYSTALSANGTTAVIGGPADNSGVGAAWAFVLPPTVVSEPASSITQTAATLNATVNPNGQSVTSCVFEYGPTSSYGSTQPCSSLPGSGTSPVAVSATLTTLNPSASYHYRIAATNAGGTSYGGDQSFTTLSSPPAVVSEPATGVMHTTATLNATVNPNNQTVSSCQFEYGETLPYEFSVPCSSLPGSGASPVSVSASLTGLDTRALYHYRIVATNPTGTSDGSDQTFATALGPAAPAVTTEAASSLTQTSATLNASVNPNGQRTRVCEFEYGPTTSYGTTVPCSALPGNGESAVTVSTSLTGLAANATYHFRIVATDATGTSDGGDATFTTPPYPPTVLSEPASSITQTAATLNATVNPNGQSVTSCVFEYGPTSSFGSSVACSSLPGSGTGPVGVSAALTGLTPSSTLHFRIVATNPGGTSYGSEQTFTTLSSPPAVVTSAATAVTRAEATLNATVNPNNQTVSECKFEYGETLPYESSVPCSSLPGSGASPVSVSAAITGLDTRALYHFRIVATNPTGTSDGSDETFATAPGTPSTTFTYTGGEQTFSVPAGIASVNVVAVGGHGGNAAGGAPGGEAAQVSGQLGVTPGQTLYVQVAGNGQSEAQGGAGGFNGGGASGPEPSGGGGGGGASDVRTAPRSAGLSPDLRLIVAAGGGGAGGPCEHTSPGGGAGGAAGQNGGTTQCSNGSGTAGTASSGGHSGYEKGGGDCGIGQAGELGQGGAGSGHGYSGEGASNGYQAYCHASTGGGGGGGLYGGAGGAGGDTDAGGGGGGGSSLVPAGGSESLASLSSEPEVRISYRGPSPELPTVVTEAASSLTQTSASLNAIVNPNGQKTRVCQFEYGPTTSYGTTVPCSALPGNGESPVAVSASLTGLAVNATYHFRISAADATGTSPGGDKTFTTPPNPPAVVSEPASAITQTGATLNATVNPNGAAVSECHFEYGPTESYGSSAPCSSSPGSGTTPVAVSASLTGLTVNSSYHFRIAATGPGGTSYGGDRTFATLPNPPTVATEPATPVAQTTATLQATVNPNGGTVSDCHFEYGTTTSYGTNAPCAVLPGSGTSPVVVSAALTGLTPNTTYHFRISAANAGGTSLGGDRTLTTPPDAPTVATEAASAVLQTSATLNATVNPNGGTVSDCHFEYGTTTSYGTSVPCSSLPGSGTSPVAVSAQLAGLAGSTTYHFRISATNPGGTSLGTDRTFMTATATAPEFGRCAAVAPVKEGGKTVYHGGFTASTCLTKSATNTGKYEWMPGVTRAGFTTVLKEGEVTLETITKSKVTCKTESAKGQYRGSKEVASVVASFTGCEESGRKCTTGALGEGDLETEPLEGVLGWEAKATKKAALDLYPVGKAGEFMEYRCAATALITLTGSLIAPVTVDKMVVTTTLKYKATGGKQAPEHFEGQANDVLMEAINGGAAEQLGLTSALTQINEEPVEINAAV